MKKFLKYLFLVIFITILGGYLYLRFGLPNVSPAENITIEVSPDQIERGKYLANHVMLCVDCHSERDFNYYAGPIKEGTFGAGGESFNHDLGFPGTIISKNITPAALKTWTDGEIFRALVSGVSKDGNPLFGVMPFQNYAQLDRADLYAVIAYIRTLDPIEKVHPETELDFPVNLIMRTIPKDEKVESKRPSPDNKLAYGKYIFTAASCAECHSQRDKGDIIPELENAGGVEFKFPDGNIVRSANLTSDKETGLGNWTEEAFIARFKAFSDSVYSPQKLHEGQVNTIMPWLKYAGMTNQDLSALYAYLQNLSPIKNEVVKFSPSK